MPLQILSGETNPDFAIFVSCCVLTTSIIRPFSSVSPFHDFTVNMRAHARVREEFVRDWSAGGRGNLFRQKGLPLPPCNPHLFPKTFSRMLRIPRSMLSFLIVYSLYSQKRAGILDCFQHPRPVILSVTVLKNGTRF